MPSGLKQTPLYQEHLALNARMVPFAGWEMPVQYRSVIKEHEAVRTGVGLFDVSHMGEFFVSGPQAEAFLNRVTTNNVKKLSDGRCQYTLLCYENGTVVDDLIVSRITPERYLMVVNAANIDKDFDWLRQNNKEGAELQNVSDNKALLAVQGPKSAAVLKKLLGPLVTRLQYYHFQGGTYNEGTPLCRLGSFPPHETTAEGHLLVSRTGYTGEDGFEIMVDRPHAVKIWRAVLEAGQEFNIQPAGLAARNTLRLEAGLALYGHELSDRITALEAGLGWVVKMDKGDFIGREALLAKKEKGVRQKIAGIKLIDSGIAREHDALYYADQKIGVVTSGTYSPTLKISIALALMDSNFAEPGTEITVDIRGKKKKAIVVKRPFYRRTS